MKLEAQRPRASLAAAKDHLDAEEQGPAGGLMTFDQPPVEIRFPPRVGERSGSKSRRFKAAAAGNSGGSGFAARHHRQLCKPLHKRR